MRLFLIILTTAVIVAPGTNCHAGCNCDDWVNRDGYCVDYVKAKIPTFPVPNDVAEITTLKNREIPEVSEGDVAIFDLGRYWHVAYVEKVHLDKQGNATAIDVSEMNFGGELSYQEYKGRWSPKSENEWKRALCCGVTDKYSLTSSRKNVSLSTVTQVWSPAEEQPEGNGISRINTFVNKVREVLNRFIPFTWREL